MPPVDITGTSPGLIQEEKEPPKEVHVRCKNPSCDSILAVEIEFAGHKGGGNRMYQCCKCGKTWGISVGGSVNL